MWYANSFLSRAVAVAALATALSRVLPASAQSELWSLSIGDTGDDFVISAAVDPGGGVIVWGMFEGTIVLGPDPLVSVGGTDVFLAQYDANGVYQWSQRFGSTLDDAAFELAVDVQGRIAITGHHRGSINFGGGPLPFAGNTDIFIASFNADGTHRWSKGFGSAPFDQGLGIATDSFGNVFASGHFTQTVDFGGGPLVCVGVANLYVAKYNDVGDHKWSLRAGDTSCIGFSVATDASDNVLVVGQFTGTMDLGGGPLQSIGSAFDIHIAVLNNSGAHVWSRSFGDTGDDQGISVVADSGGDVIATGYFENTVSFGSGQPLVSAGGKDIFVAKFAGPNGVKLWAQRFGDNALDQGSGVVVDLNDNVLVTGRFSGKLTFGANKHESLGDTDIFVFQMDGFGNHQWSAAYGGHLADGGLDIASVNPAEIVAAGYYRDTVDFGAGPQVSAGGSDGYVVKLSLPDLTSARGADAGVALLQNEPNPFNPSTRIGFTLERDEHVTLTVYDVRGARVATLLDGHKPQGAHSLEWNGRDNSGRELPSGVYFYQLHAGGRSLERKAVLLK
jgi:hypothetical protein